MHQQDFEALQEIRFPVDQQAIHYSAVKAMCQAAVNVELFTIPLYMCSMYSLTGSHQITGSNALYRGRWWPGLAPTPDPTKKAYLCTDKLPIDDHLFSSTNNEIFNKIFKVFIEEMLHLELASNLSKTLGVKEISYTSPLLMNQCGYNWSCYQGTTIPHIVDLKDTKSFSDLTVEIGPLDKQRIRLFQAIESPEEDAEKELAHCKDKYFPNIPFEDWTTKSDETDLPLFGSIGYMYSCLWSYLHIQYEDGKNLLEYIIEQEDYTSYPQNDLFNVQSPTHPLAEYPGVNTTTFGGKAEYLYAQIQDMLNAITEQGEGGDIQLLKPQDKHATALGLDIEMAVAPQDQADLRALSRNYPSHTDTGAKCPFSADAQARAGQGNAAKDHEELFQEIEQLMKKEDFLTWDQWHAQGNKWTAEMLAANDYINNSYKDKLPQPEEVADAMNRLKTDEGNYRTLSQAAVGAIKGITTVLNKYWSTKATQTNKKPSFPYPAMSGSGDRVAICWAVFGRVPDIAHIGIDRRDPRLLNHACQGMNLDPSIKDDAESCAHVAIYHTCKGSNTCRAEGGCGFVHQIGSHSNCSHSGSNLSPSVASCSTSVRFSPPGNNACGGQGGCAVPISQSQLFPKPKAGAIQPNPTLPPIAYMQPNFYSKKDGESKWQSCPLLNSDGAPKSIRYQEGDNVYDNAWDRYVDAFQKMNPGKEAPAKPAVSDIRLAFPPST